MYFTSFNFYIEYFYPFEISYGFEDEYYAVLFYDQLIFGIDEFENKALFL